MRNEAEHVDGFVADVAAQDFDGEVELIVADGGSTDRSVDRLRTAAERHGLELTTLSNEAAWVSHGLNACIGAATGDLLVRLDCHSSYPADYLGRCARAAEETGALVVGGVIEPVGRTHVERAVACAMDTAFGGIGFYRVLDGGMPAVLGVRGAPRDAGAGRVDTDTLTFGAFRPAAFELAGLFDESLRRNQDDELNLRVRAAGGRVVLDPSIRVRYTPRGSLRGVFAQYFEYGYWKVAVMWKHRQPPSARSLTPLAFVTSLAALATLAPRSRAARGLLLAEVALYGSLAVAAGSASARRRREPRSLLPTVLAVFPAFHLGYGLGTLRGLARAGALALGRADRF
jgi:glycosyltransferase involved in cell wall biosynthesis